MLARCRLRASASCCSVRDWSVVYNFLAQQTSPLSVAAIIHCRPGIVVAKAAPDCACEAERYAAERRHTAFSFIIGEAALETT